MIPTAPAIACAYWRRDGKLRTSLPLKETPYSRSRAKSTTAQTHPKLSPNQQPQGPPNEDEHVY
jgi:hypothetical protein